MTLCASPDSDRLARGTRWIRIIETLKPGADGELMGSKAPSKSITHRAFPSDYVDNSLGS